MGRLRVRRPSPALIVSAIALVVALGGTSYAALTLPKNSVGTRQLRNGAVTLTKIAAHARSALAGARGVTGATGSPGPQGPQGNSGPPGPLQTSGGGLKFSASGDGTFLAMHWVGP